LGATNTIWKTGIPFAFDFSRINTANGYVYPTALDLTVAGPSQIPAIMNSANYIDTFIEYIISLIMLWATIFFPWWLLRIFRDYCCDGIYAMKNILLSMYDQMHGGPPNPPAPGPTPINTNFGTSMNISKTMETTIKNKLETTEQIKKVNTQEISRSLNLTATKLTDVARFETNKATNETVRKNLDYLQNPTKAETPNERQKFMNIRTELFSRAVKEDKTAQQIISATSSSKIEQLQKREEILQTSPQMMPVTSVVSIRVQIPQKKVSSVNAGFTDALTSRRSLLDDLAQTVKIPTAKVEAVMTAFKQRSDDTPLHLVDHIARETNLTKEQVGGVLQQAAKITQIPEVVQEIGLKANLKPEEVQRIIANQIPLVVEPEKNIEQTISIPSNISIEEYEEVKKMWMEQYEKGEIPLTENITSRKKWVEKDIVFITNTLNKLVAVDDKLRNEGLDDIAYILPIFLINNLKGDELAVYLKAKLEAAKMIAEQMDREKEIAEKLKIESEKETVNVDVARPKAQEAEKTMKMEEEIKK
jgi:hypothetical protein